MLRLPTALPFGTDLSAPVCPTSAGQRVGGWCAAPLAPHAIAPHAPQMSGSPGWSQIGVMGWASRRDVSGMNAIPVTTTCYANRIAVLQQMLNSYLEQSSSSECTPEFLDLLEDQIQPIYAAIWAMHAETEHD